MIDLESALKRPLCVYHANCADGFAAAWVVRKYFGEVDFHPGVYQDPPPDVTGRDVILVDFSYKSDVLREMAEKARSILVLDHHASAAIEFARINHSPADFADWRSSAFKLGVVFDMTRSGARIAWDFFFPDFKDRPPKLLLHVEDRDLWRFALPGTREIQAALFSYPYDFYQWDLLMGSNCVRLRSDGEAIERKHHKDIAELVKVVVRRMVIGGYNVPVANLPYTLTSDAGHLLAQSEPFAGCYCDVPVGRVFSLRSTEDGVDVSQIATQYGGGGHRNAAGFRVSFEQARQFEVQP
jgi:oligoribonuclease NrnB/cAMP/cGMP phosphodiesterase (DHH superfamily)